MYEEAMQSKQYENYTHVNVPPFTIVHTFYEKLREATVVKFFSHWCLKVIWNPHVPASFKFSFIIGTRYE